MPIENTLKLPVTITFPVVKVEKELLKIATRPKSPQADNPQEGFGSGVPSTATSVSTQHGTARTAFGSPVSYGTPKRPDSMFEMQNIMPKPDTVVIDIPQPVLNAADHVAINIPKTPETTTKKETFLSQLSEFFAPNPQ